MMGDIHQAAAAAAAAAPAAGIFNRDRQEAVLRIQRNAIAADLRQIQADLHLDILQQQRERNERIDQKTIRILDWHQLFTRVIEVTDQPHQEFEEFKALMQQILVDPIFRAALDDNCLLGSDGETYTDIVLQLYRNMAPAQYQNRSPLHPEVEAPLETTPHIYARYMVAWLKRHNVNHRNANNDTIEEAYRQLNLLAHRVAPPAHPADQDELMRQIMANQARRQMRRDLERNGRIQARRIELEEQRRRELVPLVQRGFAEVAQRVDEVAQRQLDQANQLNQDLVGQINVLQPAIDHLEAEIVELAQRERDLAGQNNRIQVGIGGLRATHQQLAAETAQLKKQIKENEKAGLKILGNALLTIGLCALGTLAAKCIMEAMAAASAGASGAGTSVVVKPLSKGFMFQATVRF